jgi:hypothetical protein
VTELDLERRVDEVLAPLRTISPARRANGRPRRRRELAIAAVISCALFVLAAGATYATIVFTASPEAAPVSQRGSLACLDLVGNTAQHAGTVLEERGYPIKWRLEAYGAPAGKTFTTTSPESVAPTAIVEDVTPGADGSVLVFVHASDDPYAPTPVPPPCP